MKIHEPFEEEKKTNADSDVWIELGIYGRE